MSEVASFIGCTASDHRARNGKARRLLQRLEKRYGVTLLIRLGGTLRVGRWYCPREALEAVLTPKRKDCDVVVDDSLQVMELLRTIEDLKIRVENLERHHLTPHVGAS